MRYMRTNEVSSARGEASRVIGREIAAAVKYAEKEAVDRAYRIGGELVNASLTVLRGRRGGRAYRMPGARGGRFYRASAPGERPAERTGMFRLSWRMRIRAEKRGVRFRAVSSIQSDIRAGGRLLGDMLEHGTRRMAPRPYKQAVIDKALSKIKEI